jgi:acyl carrier protein
MGNNIETSIRQYILDQFVYDDDTANTLTNETPLIDNGIVDSFGVLSIIEFLESTYGIQIADEDVVPQNMGTIGGITQLVERKIALET